MVLFIACLAITVVAGKLTGTGEVKVFKIGKPLGLSCTSDGGDTNKIVWSRAVDGDDKDDKKPFKNVGDIGGLKGRYQIYKSEGKFVIDKAFEEDAGDYQCSLGDDSITFKAAAMVAVKVADNIYSIEDEKLEIICNAVGTDPKITWKFLPEKRNDSVETITIDGDFDRYKLEDEKGIENSKLIIDPSKISDRGTYTCVGTNEYMTGLPAAESVTFLRVKDKLAALWPFLGICAEVFLLCAIILIYEKRRNKTDLDDSDTDQSPDQKHDHKDSDVRHRK